MAWNHLIHPSIHPSISRRVCQRARKKLAHMLPQEEFEKVVVPWPFPPLVGYWVTCPKLQVFRKKKHVKIGSSPSKKGGGKSKIENSKIWTFSSCKILGWSRSKFKEIPDSWCMILDGHLWISIGMCWTLILNNDIKSLIGHINWLRACEPKMHVQHLNKELLNRTRFPPSKKENITMERANITPSFFVAKKWPSQTRKDARIKDATKHECWICGSFKT